MSIVNALKNNDDIIPVKTKTIKRNVDPDFVTSILLPSECILMKRFIEYLHRKKPCTERSIQILLSIISENFGF